MTQPQKVFIACIENEASYEFSQFRVEMLERLEKHSILAVISGVLTIQATMFVAWISNNIQVRSTLPRISEFSTSSPAHVVNVFGCAFTCYFAYFVFQALIADRRGGPASSMIQDIAAYLALIGFVAQAVFNLGDYPYTDVDSIIHMFFANCVFFPSITLHMVCEIQKTSSQYVTIISMLSLLLFVLYAAFGALHFLAQASNAACNYVGGGAIVTYLVKNIDINTSLASSCEYLLALLIILYFGALGGTLPTKRLKVTTATVDYGAKKDS